MLVYPAGIDLSHSMLRRAARVIAAHRRATGSRWRRLTPSRQALLVLAHLCRGDTYAQLAAGFRVGIATVYRYIYIRETVDLLAALAPTLRDVVTVARAKAYVILDGTLLPIDRVAADRPYHSGKHKRHGMNVQVLADPLGRLIWASPALPEAVHDLRAARTHAIIEALTTAGVRTWADKTYQGAGGTLTMRYRGRWHSLSAGQARGQPLLREDPSRRRTGQRRLEDLAPAAQTTLLTQPHHHPGTGHPHPSPGGLALTSETLRA